jgi:hypothetical protein
MTAADSVRNLTTHERTRLDEIQRACPFIDVQLISRGDGYLILGYLLERDTALIRVENDSLPQGIRQFRAAYEKLRAFEQARRAVA